MPSTLAMRPFAFTLLCAVGLVLLASCDGTPPTATPTPVPAPTATPEPTPDAMTPSPETGSLKDLVITDSTTVGDLLATLSESEIACAGVEIDPAADSALLDAPLLENFYMLDSFSIECLDTGRGTTLLIAILEAQTSGRLSTETKTCLSELYTENWEMLIQEAQNTPLSAVFGLESFLCLSDEEAPSTTDGGAPFKPSELRCAVEQAGGIKALASLLSSDPENPPDPAGLALMAAINACGEMGQ